jgi:hypothetical protein
MTSHDVDWEQNFNQGPPVAFRFGAVGAGESLKEVAG